MELEKQDLSLHVWSLVEDKFNAARNPVQETLFALGNGYIGLRGAHEEAFDGVRTLDGTFINGFYESVPIVHPEPAYGYAKNHQFMLNVPNGKLISFDLDRESFNLSKGSLNAYKRTLDFRTGLMVREVEWTSPEGKQVEVKSQRCVSFAHKNLFAISYEARSINFNGVMTLRTAINGDVSNVEAGEDPRFGAAMAGAGLQLVSAIEEEDFAALVQRTENSGFTLVSATENDLKIEDVGNYKRESREGKQSIEQIYHIEIKAGETVRLTKYGVYFSSKEHPVDQLLPLAKQALKDAKGRGFEKLCVEQKEFLTSFWHHAEVEIEGNDSLQQGVHFSQFHLLQSVGRDGLTSVAAKGLTGEGYGGHYFWDAEIYALPFYLYSQPDIARKMLEYRHSILKAARARAREMSHKKGALFAWRTIGGEECSPYYPAGTAQYHINADIAYAVKQYYDATQDDDFMLRFGAEIVIDTARIWTDLGTYVAAKNNQFCIHGVTGPDEYTALVNNNLYTNIMAQMHLRLAAQLVSRLKRENPKDFERIAKEIDLSQSEPEEWVRAADSMYIPYDERLRIHPQDDSFLEKKVWDFTGTPRENHPLLLYYHYLVIYRHQVLKQADVVLALFLLGNRFNMEDKRRDYDYYEAITTHDSSLSHCTYSIMASEVGYHEKAYRYFTLSARGDLDNSHGNTAHGVHIAAMAGTWSAVIFGFGGMRVHDGELEFNPYLPGDWSRYKFRVYYKGQLLQVEVRKDGVTYHLLEGSELKFAHGDEQVIVSEADPRKSFSSSDAEKSSKLDEQNRMKV
jgi:alpha,alpha-trehalose phosphorylase